MGLRRHRGPTRQGRLVRMGTSTRRPRSGGHDCAPQRARQPPAGTCPGPGDSLPPPRPHDPTRPGHHRHTAVPRCRPGARRPALGGAGELLVRAARPGARGRGPVEGRLGAHLRRSDASTRPQHCRWRSAGTMSVQSHNSAAPDPPGTEPGRPPTHTPLGKRQARAQSALAAGALRPPKVRQHLAEDQPTVELPAPTVYPAARWPPPQAQAQQQELDGRAQDPGPASPPVQRPNWGRLVPEDEPPMLAPVGIPGQSYAPNVTADDALTDETLVQRRRPKPTEGWRLAVFAATG